MKVDWDSFSIYNLDARGIHYKFEDLCRQLFMNENISGNKQFRYLHANPNNYGLETEPVFDEINKRWIGFQAKFFDGDVDYNQIKHSAKKTVEYYTGKQGIVNTVYLFCNKPITSTAKGYQDTKKILEQYNIELHLVTDTAILDLVRSKYSYLAQYYFGNHSIRPEWFATHAGYMFDELGERYNRQFNVETKYSQELSLFLHDQEGASFLNMKKRRLLMRAEELYNRRNKSRVYLRTLMDVVSSLPDVNTETMYDAVGWEVAVADKTKSFIDDYDIQGQKLEEELNKQSAIMLNPGEKQEDRRAARKSCVDLRNRIAQIDELTGLCDYIKISDKEKELLYNDVLFVYGRAGTGKSQLLAFKTNNLLAEHRSVLLLLGGLYFSELPIQEQIMGNLRLNYSFEDLVDILESIGEKKNCVVPVIIDAINETWNKQYWKTGLPSMIDTVKKAPMVRLVISYRTEYAAILLPDSVGDKIRNRNIITLEHRGFEENRETAVREFLNHHNIPFTPLEYFKTELSNSLFLTLYCKTYDGNEVSLPMLYERLMEKANSNIYRTLRLDTKGFLKKTELYKIL